MVDVTHYGNNRSTRFEIFRRIDLFGNGLLYVGCNVFCLIAKLFGYEVDRLSVHALVDADHDTDAHTRTNNLRYGNVHHLCQFVSSNELGELQYFAFSLCFATFFFSTCVLLLTLFLTILSTFTALLLAGEACQRFLYLLSNVFFRYLGLLLFLGTAIAILVVALAIVALAILVVAVLIITAPIVAIIVVTLLAVVVAILLRLISGIVNVDTLRADAVALLALAVAIALSLTATILTATVVILITVATALVLRLLFRTCG